MSSKKPVPEVKIQADAIIKGVVHRTCPKCNQTKPLNDFGLRTITGGGLQGRDQVRNQSWCRECR